jgi:hypothetical protein
VNTVGGIEEEWRQRAEGNCSDLNKEQQRTEPDTEREK